VSECESYNSLLLTINTTAPNNKTPIIHISGILPEFVSSLETLID
jgi:hypothetical protein